jgi:hypothetical protein
MYHPRISLPSSVDLPITERAIGSIYVAAISTDLGSVYSGRCVLFGMHSCEVLSGGALREMRLASWLRGVFASIYYSNTTHLHPQWPKGPLGRHV